MTTNITPKYMNFIYLEVKMIVSSKFNSLLIYQFMYDFNIIFQSIIKYCYCYKLSTGITKPI